MNTTILDDPIYSIHYISQVPSTSPISEIFPIDTRRKIYVVAIDNEEPSLASTSVQLIQYKQKCAISSSVMITLSWRHTSAIASLE